MQTVLRRRTITRLASPALLAPLMWACNDVSAPPAPVATSIVAVSPVEVTGTAGQPIPDSVSVRVLDQNGNPLANALVTFSVVEGGGSVSPTSARTDAQGVARTQWTLGSRVGANAVEARAEGVTAPVALRATGAAGPAAKLELVSSGTVAGTAGQPTGDSVSVRALDQYGNPVSNAVVTFSVVEGGGSVSPPSARTDAQGIAKTRWTLGPRVGANALEARVEGVAGPVAVSASGAVGPAAKFEILSGANQTDTVGQSLQPIVLRLTDAHGNPIVGSPIEWYWGWPLTSGTFTPASSATDANGQWYATWTLGQRRGDFQVTVVNRPSGMALGIVAKAVPDIPVSVVFVPVGSPMVEFDSTDVYVLSRDQFGNPSGGLTVDLTPTNGSSVNPARVTTDADAAARVVWKMPAAPRVVELMATAVGSGNRAIVTASLKHAGQVGLVVGPDPSYAAPSQEVIFSASVIDKYGHRIPTRGTCSPTWSITPPGYIRPTVGMLEGSAYASGPQMGTYTVSAECGGFSDTAVLIVR